MISRLKENLMDHRTMTPQSLLQQLYNYNQIYFYLLHQMAAVVFYFANCPSEFIFRLNKNFDISISSTSHPSPNKDPT